METFKRSLAFIGLLAGILLGAEIFAIVRNEYITYTFESKGINDWLSFFILLGVYGAMLGVYVFIFDLFDKFKAKKTLKRKKEDEANAKMVRSKITKNILSKLSNEELNAIMKNKDLINFNFLVSYHQEIKIPQEQLLKEVNDIINNKN